MSSVTQTAHTTGHEGNIATTNGICRWPTPKLDDHILPGRSSEHHSSKTNITAKTPQQEDQCIPDLIEPTEEVIKVYLETRHKTDHRETLKMLADEGPQVQEVRYCLKTLREQMAARKDSTNKKVRDNQEETGKLKETTKRLYAHVKELEKKHNEERERLEAESSEFRRRLEEQTKRLQKAEGQSEERGQQIDELQGLLGHMEMESSRLKEQAANGEAELLQLKAENKQVKANDKRYEELEKERDVLKEKIHHLDDMLKSQQRKVRHMIEQLQNSRTIIQDKDRVIRDLEEKVAFLEAENIEMHDHMEYLLSVQNPPPPKANENKPQVVYSKPLTPSTQQHNKSLPFIKVIEIKS